MLGILWLLFQGIPQLFKSDKKNEGNETKYESKNSKILTPPYITHRHTDVISKSSIDLKDKLEETNKKEGQRVKDLSKDTSRIHSSRSHQIKIKPLVHTTPNYQNRETTIPLKDESTRIENILKRNGIDRLFHFTDKANLDSIRKHGGLYSWEYCNKNNIEIVRPGGNQLSRKLDSKKNLGNYVRLSFKSNIPMLYIALGDGRLQNPFTLEINPKVILWQSTLFCDGNATSSRSNIGNGLSHFEMIRFDILNLEKWTSEEEKYYWQAEVLVKEHIPLKYINNI